MGTERSSYFVYLSQALLRRDPLTQARESIKFIELMEVGKNEKNKFLQHLGKKNINTCILV